MIRFAHPQLLWLLLSLPFWAFWVWREAGRPGRLLADHGGEDTLRRLLPDWSRGRSLAKGLLGLLALAFWMVAAAGPQLGTRQVDVQRKGVDVVVAVDVSQSMAAQDLAPDRMARARHSIRQLLEKLQGDRVALMPFSGSAFLQHPLTSDYSLSGLFTDLLKPGLIPMAGTDLGGAIRRAVSTYQETAPGQRVLIILSDGEDFEDNWKEALAEAREAGVVIYTVGMGTPEGAPVPDPARPGAYKLDRQGSIVLSRLNEQVLQEVAAEGGGAYQRSTPGGDELVKILERIGEMEGRELGSRMYTGWQERYAVFLVPGLVLGLLSWLWPARRSPRPSAGSLPILLLALAAALPARADHVRSNNRAIKSYQKGEFGVAAEGFTRSLQEQETARSRFNLGDALYRGGDLEAAAGQYRQAAAAADADPALAARAWANLGRVMLDQEQLDAACQALEEALVRDPALTEARHNLELALRRKQEQKGDQGKQDSKDQQKKQDEQGKQDSAGQQGQQKQQQGQQGQQPGQDKQQQGQKQPQPGQHAQAGDSSAAQPQRIDPAQLQQLLNAVEAQEREAQERQLLKLPATGRKVEKDW